MKRKSKLLEQFTNKRFKKNEVFSDDDLSEKSIIIKEVNKNVKKNSKKCMEFDPILCMEWDQTGLDSRYNANNQHTKQLIENQLNITGEQIQETTTLWKFKSSGDLTLAIYSIITQLNWTKKTNSISNIVLGCFMIQADRKDHFINTPLPFFDI
jgi:hypothetical protein